MAGEDDENLDPGHSRVRALARIMGDPVRAKILFAVAEAAPVGERRDAPQPGIAIRKIAERVEEPPRRVRYHLERLVEEKFVAVTGRRTRRGVVERLYGATEVPAIRLESTRGRTVPIPDQRQLTLEILKAIFADARSALSSGTYNSRPEWIASRLTAEVDERGWHELSAIQERALAEAEAVLEEARGRAGADAERFRVVVAELLFEGVPR